MRNRFHTSARVATRQRVKEAMEMGCAKVLLIYVKGAVAGE